MNWIKELVWNIVKGKLLTGDAKWEIVDALLPAINERVIERLSRGFDIHVRDTLVPKVGEKEEYVVYESERPSTLWFLIDLSNAREGDLFEIKLYIRLSNGDFLLHDHYELENQRKEPVATLSSRFSPGCRFTITQVRGLSKEIGFEVYGRYEEK